MNDNVFIYALDTRKTYEEFRKLKVHTYEVDALLKLNLDALESVSFWEKLEITIIDFQEEEAFVWSQSREYKRDIGSSWHSDH